MEYKRSTLQLGRNVNKSEKNHNSGTRRKQRGDYKR